LIESTLLSAGNFGLTDDSGDGIKEPLLGASSFAADTQATGDIAKDD
jgi:hypothetical protein